MTFSVVLASEFPKLLWMDSSTGQSLPTVHKTWGGDMLVSLWGPAFKGSLPGWAWEHRSSRFVFDKFYDRKSLELCMLSVAVNSEANGTKR